MDRKILEPAIQQFILEHMEDEPAELALKYREIKGVPINLVIDQIKSRRIISRKVPDWAEIQDLYLPPPISMEQCSSWETAWFKTRLSQARKVTDLTGGTGVDSFAFAKSGVKVDYIERNPELCEIAGHNFEKAGIGNITVFNRTAEDQLQQMRSTELIYLDPSRRSGDKKVFSVEDSEPDLTRLWKRICEVSGEQLVKLSPMVDLHQVLRSLGAGIEFILLSVRNELKEVLVYRDGSRSDTAFRCVDLFQDKKSEFRFTELEERRLSAELSDPLAYIYEPNAAVMKSGGFNSLSSQLGIPKLAPNTHLFTSDKHMVDFPGKTFRLIANYTVREFPVIIRKANLSVRNFPITAPELKKKLKLKDGGPDHIFGCTLSDGSHRLLHVLRED